MLLCYLKDFEALFRSEQGHKHHLVLTNRSNKFKIYKFFIFGQLKLFVNKSDKKRGKIQISEK
jgi:hypothetical protein